MEFITRGGNITLTVGGFSSCLLWGFFCFGFGWLFFVVCLVFCFVVGFVVLFVCLFLFLCLFGFASLCLCY